MRELAALEAKCARCGSSFSHPDLGDFSYGEAVLCSADGSHFAVANAFSEFSQRLRSLIGQESFWPMLAALADPIAGQPLSASIRCPVCASTSLAYWGGDRTGAMLVPEALFTTAGALGDDLLSVRIASVSSGAEA